MNGKNKRILFTVIFLQIFLLVLPASVKSVNQYVLEKNAPVKGAEFTFLASNVWMNDDMLYISSHLQDDYYEYVSSRERLQLTSDENGYAFAVQYNKENDFYVYGRYVSLNIPLEELSFWEGYDLQKLNIMLTERDNISEWYISGLDYEKEQLSEWFSDKAYVASFTARVYKGVVLPEGFYIDGVKVLEFK